MGAREIRFCDRCKREDGSIIPVFNCEIVITTTDDTEVRVLPYRQEMDLCPSCKDLLVDTIKEVLRCQE